MQVAYLFILLFPLLGCLVAAVCAFLIARDLSQGNETRQTHHKYNRVALGATICGMLGSVLLTFYAFYQVVIVGSFVEMTLFPWIKSSYLTIDWSLRFDVLTVCMLFLVVVVSTMVHIYSVGYMSHDTHRAKFQCYLSLFTVAMMILVTSNNLIQLFFGWEGVGLASYLLIGFWYQKPSACAAAIKAFVVNRVGDFGFLLGIFMIFLIFGTVDFNEIFTKVDSVSQSKLIIGGYSFHALTVACLLLFIGAMGKSAQLGLHTWLPDAMEGPTPVSALIHAATMVTAGVFMVARLSPLFEYSPLSLDVITVVGATTAFFAATIGCVQNDIKRVIAYSTCSQLGYMFFACGVSAYSAGIWHLINHGFFKALLFLGAGSVIHAMSDEQDMRKMGGLWKMIPQTFAFMIIGTLALTGFPLLSGWYSKDLILESAFMAHSGVGLYAFVLGILAAGMTSFYSWRLIFMTFWGTSRSNETTLAHVHESSPVMLYPLIPLALGAIFLGFLTQKWFMNPDMSVFWNHSLFMDHHHQALHDAHHAPWWVKGWYGLPALMFWSGLILAFVMYVLRPGWPAIFRQKCSLIYKFLVEKWFFDQLYHNLFVRPVFFIGSIFWKKVDQGVIDHYGPNGARDLILFLSKKVSRLQTGFFYHYAFAMFIGLFILVSYTFIILG